MVICAAIRGNLLTTFKYVASSSSTAQGGGGSFKNRKPIGEIGCCESRMAERSQWWTDRWLWSLLLLSLSFSFSDYVPTYLPIYLSIFLSIYLSLSVCLSIYLSLCLSVYLSLCLSVCLPVYLQAWQSSYSARLPHCSTLTTSNTKQFSETSSMFAHDNVKNEASLRDFLISRSWQHQKRSNSARLLNFWTWQHPKRSNSARLLNFWTWQHQKQSNSARLPSKMESWLQRSTASYQ